MATVRLINTHKINMGITIRVYHVLGLTVSLTYNNNQVVGVYSTTLGGRYPLHEEQRILSLIEALA